MVVGDAGSVNVGITLFFASRSPWKPLFMSLLGWCRFQWSGRVSGGRGSLPWTLFLEKNAVVLSGLELELRLLARCGVRRDSESRPM